MDCEGTQTVDDCGIFEQSILIISVILNIVFAYVLRVVGGAMYPFFIVVSLWSMVGVVHSDLGLRLEYLKTEWPTPGHQRSVQ
jgi:hypothetical protein